MPALKPGRNLKYDALMRHAAREFGRKPAMIVQIVSDYNGNSQRLQWGDIPPYPPETFPLAKFYGRFACFPLEVHDGGTLIEAEEEKEPTLEVPRRLLEELREASLSGFVRVETLAELKQLLTDHP